MMYSTDEHVSSPVDAFNKSPVHLKMASDSHLVRKRVCHKALVLETRFYDQSNKGPVLEVKTLAIGGRRPRKALPPPIMRCMLLYVCHVDHAIRDMHTVGTRKAQNPFAAWLYDMS